MNRVTISIMVLVLGALGGANPGWGQEAPIPQGGELRIVDKSPANWISITFNVMEHLMELDHNGKLVPRLATAWRWLDDRTLEVTLRQGVRFHNGEVFDAEIVRLNWENHVRLRQPFAAGTYMNFKPGSHLVIVDPYTVRFVFPEPDGGAIAKLTAMHMGNRQFYRDLGWGEEHW